MEAQDETSVLIVDDHRDTLKALRATLESLSVRVLECTSGEEALRTLLKEHRVAAILLDIRLPQMDGFETALAIREHPAHRNTPILFLTGLSRDKEYVARGYELGAVDYLIKPIVPEFLRAKVRVFCDLFEKTRALERRTEILTKEIQGLSKLASSEEPSELDLDNEAARYTEYLRVFLKSGGENIAQEVASELFERRVSGTQFIEVHLVALERIVLEFGSLYRTQAVQNSRLLVLGIMANLADAYRILALQRIVEHQSSTTEPESPDEQ